MKRLVALGALTLLLWSAPSTAQAETWYGGLHPIHPAAGGGFCYEGSTHQHPYAIDPAIGYLYRTTGGRYDFVGDPYQFGYEGQAFPYYGHHPLPGDYQGSFCYLDGAHYHAFLPPPNAASSFVVQNGYYYYSGLFPALYQTYRASYYRRYHSFWHHRSYAANYRRYAVRHRTYARPAVITYIRRPPRIVYRHRRAPVPTARSRTTRPVYRYQPGTHPTYRGKPAPQVRTYNTRYRPTRPTTSYRPVRTRPQWAQPARTRPQRAQPGRTRPQRSQPARTRPQRVRPATGSSTPARSNRPAGRRR